MLLRYCGVKYISLPPGLESRSLMFLLVTSINYECMLLLQLREENFTRLCNETSALVVNGSIPGPVIRVHRGDTAYVNVHNQGYYGVTIHR